MAIESTDERNSKADDGDDLHATALKRADEVYSAELHNLQTGREAQRFYAGEQWPDADKLARERENRAVFTINRMPAFVRQVTGDVRKDTPVPKFMPSKDGASQEVADILNGLYRNIDQQSNAKAAYVKAVENACQASIGWLRVDTEYSSDDGFEQDIRINRITDPFAVLADPSAQQPDKSDMRFAFVLDDMPIETFKEEYPDKSVDAFPSPATNGMVWKTEKTIRVAEYWYRKPVTKTLYLLEDGDVVDELPAGATATQERKVRTEEIWQCIMSGKEVLRDPQKWAGKYIPLVPVMGEEVRLDGRTIRKGMVHDAIGPQQILNYGVTAQAEQAGKAPKAPIMASKTQIAGYENEWAEAGASNAAYLPYNPDPAAGGPPQRIAPVPTNPGLSELVVQASQHLKDITGIQNANLGAPSNETSGRAIMARQREGDTGTYLYLDNLATALRRVGLILIDLFPKIYDTERVVRVLKEDDTQEMVTINQEVPATHPQTGQPMIDPETGAAITKVLNDLTVGEYDVTVSTGPGFATKRAEAAATTQSLIQAAPNLMGIAGDLFVKSLDIPYAEEIAKRIERTLPPNVLNDGPPVPPPPDPEKMSAAAKNVAQAHLYTAQASETLLQADMLAQQLAGLPQQLQALTQLVQSLVSGGPAPGAPPQPGTGPMPPPNMPPAPALAPPSAQPSGDASLAELEPIGATA